MQHYEDLNFLSETCRLLIRPLIFYNMLNARNILNERVVIEEQEGWPIMRGEVEVV